MDGDTSEPLRGWWKRRHGNGAIMMIDRSRIRPAVPGGSNGRARWTISVCTRRVDIRWGRLKAIGVLAVYVCGHRN